MEVGKALRAFRIPIKEAGKLKLRMVRQRAHIEVCYIAAPYNCEFHAV
jgi:hypothetical protein